MTSKRFEELESICKKAKISFYLKLFIVFLLLLVVAVGVKIYLFPNISKSQIIIKTKVQPHKVEKKLKSELKSKKEDKKDKNVSKKPPKTAVIDKKTTILKEPKNSLPKNDKKTEIEYDTIFLMPHIEIPLNNNLNKDENVSKSMEKKPAKTENKVKIDIKLKDKKKEIDKKIEKDDYLSNINLAHYYYKEKKYNKSIYYAKRASKMAPEQKEPWLVYIKSKIAQGKREEAIKVLQTFLSYFSSQEGEYLLRDLRSKK